MTFQRVTLAEAARGPLYLGFSRTNDWLGRLIRFFTGGKVNHAFLLYFDEHLGWMTIGANQSGVTYLPLDVFTQDRTIVDIFAPAKDPMALWKGLQTLKDDIGKKYNLSGLIGMAPVEVAQHWLHIKGGDNWLSNPHELFCSQFVADLLIAVNLFPMSLTGRLADTIDPEALDEAIAAA